MCNIFLLFTLLVFAGIMALVVVYFFVHLPAQADKKYEEQMKKIGYIGNGWF